MINEEQAQLRTQQIMEAQVGQLILTVARLRAELEQVTAENVSLKATLDKMALAAPVPVS